MFAPADKTSADTLISKHGMKMVFPLDSVLGIDNLPFKITPNMMLDIARRAVNAHSYEELQRAYLDDWNITISDDQIRMVTNYIGKLVYENDCAERDKALSLLNSGGSKAAPNPSGVLYVEMDGAMFNTRTKGENTWKENKLGVVFSSKNIVSTKTRKGEDSHKILEREYISFPGKSDIFLEHLYTVALRNGMNSHKTVVILSDGAPWIKNFKEQYCNGLDAVHILDYSHAKENIYKFAEAFIREPEAKKAWADEIRELVKHGKVDDAIRKVEPYKDKRKPGIPNLYSYFSNNRNCMNYPEYIKRGFFIGSGVIESGHRSTMQERLKLPGMRWDIESAKYVLAAKMKYDSGRWNSYVVPLLFKHLGLRRRE